MVDVDDYLKGKIKGTRAPHIHGVTEHWGNFEDFSTSTHQWYGIDKPTTRGQHGGVGAFVSHKLAKFTHILTEYSTHNAMWLQLTTDTDPIYIAVVYAPPNQNALLDEIVQSLQETFAILSSHGKILIMGDFNCRLGSLTRDKSTNPARANILKHFLTTTKSIPLKNDQSEHWTCNTSTGKSVNDLFILSKSEIKNCHDYKVFKDHSFGSDHSLLTFRWTINLTAPVQQDWITHFLSRIDWTNNDTRQQYTTSIEPDLRAWLTQFTNLNFTQTIDKATSKLVEIIQTALSKLRKKRKIHKQKHSNQQYNPALIQLRQERNANIKLLNEHSDLTSRQHLHAKTQQIQQKINELSTYLENKKMAVVWEDVLKKKENQNMKEYWKLIKNIRKKNTRNFPTIMEDQHGNKQTEKHKILKIFQDRYTKVSQAKDEEAVAYNNFLENIKIDSTRSQINETYANIQTTFTNHKLELPNHVVNSPIIPEEIEIAIKKSKKNISAGSSTISSEALQNGGPLLLQALHVLFTAWWNVGYTPKTMQKATIIPLHKKGSLLKPENYRPISLLDSIFKTYEKVLEKRLRALVLEEELLSPLQMGAIQQSGTTEALFQLLSAVHTNQTANNNVFLTFLDLSKAFDRVWRAGLWTKLWTMGVKGSLLRALHSTYENQSFQVKIGGHTSQQSKCLNGLRQGSVLSPLLFSLLFSTVVDHLDKDKGIPIDNQERHLIHTQLFVDDTIILHNRESDIPKQISAFNNFAAVWGTVLNIDKTCILSTTKLTNKNNWLEKLNMKNAHSNLTRYLGVYLSLKNNTFNQHFDKAISKARKTFFQIYSQGLKKECVSPPEALKLYKILVLPQLTFALEVITPSAGVIKKVNDFLAYTLKILLGIPLTAPNESVLWEADVPDFQIQEEIAKLRFHRKILLNPLRHVDVYEQGNYLFDINQKILQKWGLSTIGNFLSKPTTSKFSWKTIVSKQSTIQRTQLMKQFNPAFLTIKPHVGVVPQLLQLRPDLRSAILIARHSVPAQNPCLHCPQKPWYNPAFHYIFECSNPITQKYRIVLLLECKAKLGSGTSNLTKQELFQILLGKPCLYLSNNDTTLIQKVAHHLLSSFGDTEFSKEGFYN
jgi:hypothetical protein